MVKTTNQQIPTSTSKVTYVPGHVPLRSKAIVKDKPKIKVQYDEKQKDKILKTRGQFKAAFAPPEKK